MYENPSIQKLVVDYGLISLLTFHSHASNV